MLVVASAPGPAPAASEHDVSEDPTRRRDPDRGRDWAGVVALLGGGDPPAVDGEVTGWRQTDTWDVQE